MDGNAVMRSCRRAAVLGLTFLLAACGDIALRGTLADMVAAEKGSLVVPAAPSGLTAAAASTDTIHLSWTDNSDNETGFRIEWSADGSTGWAEKQRTEVDATSWDDTGVGLSETRYYRVRATNAAGDSEYSNVATASEYGVTAPAAPSNLTASATSGSTIHLAWKDNSLDESGFSVERSADGSSGWAEVQRAAANATSWDDAGLSAGNAYYYRVRAANTAGDSAYSNVASALTAQGLPAAPTGLAVAGASTTSIHLSWTDNSLNETGFRIERSANGATGWAFMRDVPADVTSWDDTGLPAGTGYYYRVRAMNSAGDTDATASAHTSTFFTDMVRINAAGDSFLMGDTTTWGPNPNVSQTITYNFSMSRHEITHSEFAQFVNGGGYSTTGHWTTNGLAWKTANSVTQPAFWDNPSFTGDNQPVVGISWYEAVAFCNWRSAQEGLESAYGADGQASLSANGYRLPTEVEWEYADAKGASGITERVFPWGSTYDSSYIVCNDGGTYYSAPAPVGSKSPEGDTPQGLTDMAGNVAEWCSDAWQSNADVVSAGSATDRLFFTSDTETESFLLRGSGFHSYDQKWFLCAYREAYVCISRGDSIGFRVVRR